MPYSCANLIFPGLVHNYVTQQEYNSNTIEDCFAFYTYLRYLPVRRCRDAVSTTLGNGLFSNCQSHGACWGTVIVILVAICTLVVQEDGVRSVLLIRIGTGNVMRSSGQQQQGCY